MRHRSPSTALRLLCALLAAVALALAGCSAHPRTAAEHRSGGPARTAPSATTQGGHRLRTVPASSLPAEAQRTLRLIAAGGPFPYPKDGVVFGNYEGVLPKEPRGYYHEYTVPTPGSRDRGARRIVTGSHQERYYSQDHYRTFVAVSSR
ncbi:MULTISPECIES: ribonuclease domain-containing protein [Streptomycetaceae]|uniref:Guanyl-specific ribonuclease n=1 Tax=Streptantibioticus cattleyicolor (strain ATCC 35852 / DSM 46488 / JCM 4925 / NBRC 14057 / NRRL 8057) TaxID=1003195 RepID=F8JSW9_STREN|nr:MULTISPECIES: ribonuclease domain-containing protein [Streptomycetaceae]AEW97725.1 guanyl-specific ribonuclease [Streptantibioticus cattleyicolor NRRL 8057 = DSM 46488]MYS62149.1 guanine-specific ribonuclease N1 and T1 [Streptomyces sp. SID5468]CCB78044.1 Guanyl-specific ribonuclease Sa3 [Streptantibioticus cattleyicolor NRRL 8057 = DSM 46488]